MIRLFVTALICLLPATTLTSARAAESAPGVRQLLFNVRYASQADLTIGEEPRIVVTRGSQAPAGTYTRHAGGRIIGAGTITVTILAVAKDRSLLLDAEENVENRRFGKTRFTVGPEGQIFFDARQSGGMHSEIVELLRLLAVNMLADHDVAPATRWTQIDPAKNGGRIETTFSIVSVEPDGRANLDINRTEQFPGADGYDASIQVKMLYDVKMLVPVKAVIASRLNSAAPNVQRSVLAETTELELVQDSFRKP